MSDGESTHVCSCSHLAAAAIARVVSTEPYAGADWSGSLTSNSKSQARLQASRLRPFGANAAATPRALKQAAIAFRFEFPCIPVVSPDTVGMCSWQGVTVAIQQ